MRILIAVTMLAALTPFFANAQGVVKSDGKPGLVDCETIPHEHPYREVRFALARVGRVDACGFGYADMESMTVGPSNELTFAPGFRVVSVGGPDSAPAVKTHPRLGRGDLGVIMYCEICRQAIYFKVETGQK